MKKNKKNKQIINTKIKQNAKKQNLNYFLRKFFHFLKINIYNVIAIFLLLCIVGVGFFFLWISSFRIPDFSAFEDRKVAQSTKIYDRTGEILLFDVNQDIKRTVISIEDMGLNIQNAIIAIEDDAFYQHKGVRFRAIARAFVNNLKPGSSTQGGSTITQQIVKNTLLTSEKRISRKIKELVISLRIEQEMSKDQILEVYLNEAPFGGNIYGVQEASFSFFGKPSQDITIAEAAYLAALPQAPTRYSPYGANKNLLDSRQRRVLLNMRNLGMISEEEYQEALEEEVEFLPLNRLGIKSPHFVFFVRDYLEQKYGSSVVEKGGLQVITTIDFDLQKHAEDVVLRNALENQNLYNASNAGLIAINPQTGEILSMVGSRDYFDTQIDGKFNIVTARRQPGSAFKPFIYATAFNKGYFPETVVFDVSTEFQSTCDPLGRALSGRRQSDCYMPQNYDGLFRGPINLRNALAQSRNIPAVKLLYLAGISDSIKTARDFGIRTLGDANQYGLTLVLGGGEVRLLDMTSAYGVFATEGIYNEPISVLEVRDSNGNILESFEGSQGRRVFNALPLQKLNSVLSDPEARIGLFSSINNFMYFGSRDVAGKTGTTNNNRDAWMVGYTPNLVVGVWSGNNDNTPMTRGSTISGLLWREFMTKALTVVPNQSFTKPVYSIPENTAPILSGNWFGGDSIIIDTISGKRATDLTPQETRQEVVVTDVNSILHWVNRNNPLTGNPVRSGNQYENWQYSVHQWWNQNQFNYNTISEDDIPYDFDDVHILETQPDFTIQNFNENNIFSENELISLNIEPNSYYPVQQIDIFINNSYIETLNNNNFNISFIPSNINSIQSQNILRVVLIDSIYNRIEKEYQFSVIN